MLNEYLNLSMSEDDANSLTVNLNISIQNLSSWIMLLCQRR